MLGKQKCKILKEIRQRIADENDIPYVTRECTFQGECKGTCPRCESELRYLEKQLALRASLGKRVAVAALCAGMTMGISACGSSAQAGSQTTSQTSSQSGGDQTDGQTGNQTGSDQTTTQTTGQTGSDQTDSQTTTQTTGQSGDQTDGQSGGDQWEEVELSGDVVYMPEEESDPDIPDEVVTTGEVPYPEDDQDVTPDDNTAAGDGSGNTEEGSSSGSTQKPGNSSEGSTVQVQPIDDTDLTGMAPPMEDYE